MAVNLLLVEYETGSEMKTDTQEDIDEDKDWEGPL